MSSTMKRRSKSADEETEQRPEVFGPSESEGREFGSEAPAEKTHDAHATAQHIQGDDMVMQVGVDGKVTDAEADAARALLKQKIINTERAINKGARDALLHQLGADADKKDDAAQEKVVEAVKEPFKEKIAEFIKGKALQSGKVKAGGAAARMMKNNLASEGSQVVGKAAGAVAVVGAVKDAVDTVEEAEVADFTASTWQGLMGEIDTNVPPAFDGYLKHVDGMDAQTAIDAAAGETVTPWVTAAQVKEQLINLFNAIEIQASARVGGPLKGGAIFDKVQEVLHPEEGDK